MLCFSLGPRRLLWRAAIRLRPYSRAAVTHLTPLHTSVELCSTRAQKPERISRARIRNCGDPSRGGSALHSQIGPQQKNVSDPCVWYLLPSAAGRLQHEHVMSFSSDYNPRTNICTSAVATFWKNICSRHGNLIQSNPKNVLPRSHKL